ncbi:MAG: hypothetical protein ACI9OJ_000300 [Myxococcota bacterium]|jgi:hypothetical protein
MDAELDGPGFVNCVLTNIPGMDLPGPGGESISNWLCECGCFSSGNIDLGELKVDPKDYVSPWTLPYSDAFPNNPHGPGADDTICAGDQPDEEYCKTTCAKTGVARCWLTWSEGRGKCVTSVRCNMMPSVNLNLLRDFNPL